MRGERRASQVIYKYAPSVVSQNADIAKHMWKIVVSPLMDASGSIHCHVLVLVPINNSHGNTSMQTTHQSPQNEVLRSSPARVETGTLRTSAENILGLHSGHDVQYHAETSLTHPDWKIGQGVLLV